MSNQHLLEEERTPRGRAEPGYRRTNPFGVNEDRDIELVGECKVRCECRIVWRHAHQLRSDFTHTGQASGNVLLPEHLRSELTGLLNEGRSDESAWRRRDPVLDDAQVDAAQESQDDVVAVHRLEGLPQ
jgi:hypothetical protein